MSDKRIPADVTQDLLVLYELSLAVGASLDLGESCEGFCRTIMARKNLTYAAVWIEGEHLPAGRSGQLEMVHSHPSQLGPRPAHSLEHPFFKTMPDCGCCSIFVEGPDTPPGNAQKFMRQGVVNWFRLQGVGFLEIATAGAAEVWPRVEMVKLRNVLEKFAVSLQGCLAHSSMVAEYEERMRSEAALQSTRNRNQWLTDNVADVIWTMDEDLKVTFVSPAIKQFAGYSPAELMAMELNDILAPESLVEVRSALGHLSRLGSDVNETYTMELAFNTTIDTLVWGEASMRILGHQDKGLEIMGVIRDISHRRQSEQMLIQAKEVAEEANRSKSAFLANMSHEIRTPLNGVVGMTRILQRGNLDSAQQKIVGTVLRSADTLLGLINNILDFSKIEAGKMAFEHRGFGLASVVEDVATLASTQAAEKNLRVYCDVPPDMPDYFIGDPLKIRQILLNLVTNAIKFTHQGHVILKVRKTPGTGENHSFAISVLDTGIGIPPDRRAVIFESFTQVDDSTSRELGGSGLGLAISQQLAQLMGARLKVEDNPGGGSIFTLHISLEPGEERRQSPRDRAEELVGKNILLASDDEILLPLLQRQMNAWDMTAIVSDDIEKIDPTQVIPDLVVRDCSDCNFLFCRECPLLPEAYQALPQIRLNAGPERLENQEGHHPDGHVAYLDGFPGQQLLLSAVHGAINREEWNLDWKVPGPEEAAFLLGRRILVAEDNKINQQVVVALLREWGCDVTLVNNGREAVREVESQTFDLILMDVQMPGMDGLDATRAIRSMETMHGRQTPIVALTAYAFAHDRDTCLAAGMDAFLSKPLNENHCLCVMKSVLEGADFSSRRTSMETDNPETRQIIDQKQAFPLVDGERLVASTRGNMVFARKLIQNYELGAERTWKGLAGHLETENLAGAELLAHSLKGASCTVGADRVSRQASELELACKSEKLKRAQTLLPLLRATLTETTKAFAAILENGTGSTNKD